jgi:hypothetical protein
MSINDIRDMSLQERMQLMELLMDSFHYDDAQPHSPQWHGDILKERAQLLQNGSVKTYTLDELKARR